MLMKIENNRKMKKYIENPEFVPYGEINYLTNKNIWKSQSSLTLSFPRIAN